MLLGSEIEIIFDVGDLQKQYLTRCQISSSKNTLLRSFMISDFKSCPGLVQMCRGPN